MKRTIAFYDIPPLDGPKPIPDAGASAAIAACDLCGRAPHTAAGQRGAGRGGPVFQRAGGLRQGGT